MVKISKQAPFERMYLHFGITLRCRASSMWSVWWPRPSVNIPARTLLLQLPPWTAHAVHGCFPAQNRNVFLSCKDQYCLSHCQIDTSQGCKQIQKLCPGNIFLLLLIYIGKVIREGGSHLPLGDRNGRFPWLGGEHRNQAPERTWYFNLFNKNKTKQKNDGNYYQLSPAPCSSFF